MNQFSAQPFGTFIRNRSRSRGIKLVVVSFLALLMAIPAVFVMNIVEDRTTRAKELVQEISGHVGGQQIFLGPVLAIPYSIPPNYKGGAVATGTYVVFPIQGDAAVKVRTEQRRRSIFKIPVFQADLNFDAAFDLAGVPSAAPTDAGLDWPHAGIVVGVSNAHGALADGTLRANGKTVTFVPAENISDPNSEQRMPLTYLGVSAKDIAQTNARIRINATLRFSGAQRLAVLAYGKTSHFTVDGDWPSPGFDGAFLPIKRTVSAQGFTGEWLVPFIAGGVRAEGTNVAVGAVGYTRHAVAIRDWADIPFDYRNAKELQLRSARVYVATVTPTLAQGSRVSLFGRVLFASPFLERKFCPLSRLRWWTAILC